MALVRTDVSEERRASIVMETRSGELGTTLAVTSSPILVTLMKAIFSPKTSVLTRAIRRNIPEDCILNDLWILATRAIDSNA
jgi:hypothetical protein